MRIESVSSNMRKLAATELGGTGGAVLVGINVIEQKIIDDTIPIVYYTKSVYYKYILDTDPPLPRAEKLTPTFIAIPREPVIFVPQ